MLEIETDLETRERELALAKSQNDGLTKMLLETQAEVRDLKRLETSLRKVIAEHMRIAGESANEITRLTELCEVQKSVILLQRSSDIETRLAKLEQRFGPL